MNGPTSEQPDSLESRLRAHLTRTLDSHADVRGRFLDAAAHAPGPTPSRARAWRVLAAAAGMVVAVTAGSLLTRPAPRDAAMNPTTVDSTTGAAEVPADGAGYWVWEADYEVQNLGAVVVDDEPFEAVRVVGRTTTSFSHPDGYRIRVRSDVETPEPVYFIPTTWQ